MNGNITLSLPTDINEDLKRLWIDTAGEAFKELIEKEKTPRYLNQGKAADYLDVSVNKFKEFAKHGLLSTTVAGVTRWDKLELDKFYQEHKN